MSIHTAAQERHISNLQIVSQDGTHVTASWDIVDGYHNSGDITGFFWYYQSRFSSTPRSINILYNSATKNATTFRYTTERFVELNSEYIMWIQARRSSQSPRRVYSLRKYVHLGKWNIYKFWGDLIGSECDEQKYSFWNPCCNIGETN